MHYAGMRGTGKQGGREWGNRGIQWGKEMGAEVQLQL